MKKIIALLLCLTLAAAMVACGGKEEKKSTAAKNLEGTMEEIIASVQEAHGAVELPLMTMAMDLTDVDALTYNTGLTSAEKISEVAVCEPMMGQPYSLVMVRANSAEDAAAVAQEMYDNIDTRKWVCMEADTKVAASYGDVAMFFMVNSDFAEQTTTDKMVEAFKTVCGGDVTVIG